MGDFFCIFQSGDTTTEDESECEERQRLICDNSLSEQSEKTTTDSAEAPTPAEVAAAASSTLNPSMQQVCSRDAPNENQFREFSLLTKAVQAKNASR